LQTLRFPELGRPDLTFFGNHAVLSRDAESSALAPFRWPDFRRLFVAIACSTAGAQAMTVVLGYEVYQLAKNPLALGILGLVEAIPKLSLALYGGHVADRHDRRRILQITFAGLVVCTVVLSLLETLNLGRAHLFLLYGVVFAAGIARGFAEPAGNALEAKVVPYHVLIHSSTVMATCWMSAAVIGPLVGGFVFAAIGSAGTYLGVSGLFAISWYQMTRMSPQPPAEPTKDESVWQSVATGVRYVWSDQILLGSMALDLFAVLFGGAVALLPVFASDILHVGKVGLGIMTAAPMSGALVTVIVANRFPPVNHAGRNLFLAVAGFGVSIIVFAFSRSFALSVAALVFSGIFDGISVVIRRAIVRLFSPDPLRGRIAAVSMIFIGSSNEIGALESGVAASLLGTVTSVFLGGLATLVIAVAALGLAPKLRRLSLDPYGVNREGSIGANPPKPG
jgi:MFS family permease